MYDFSFINMTQSAKLSKNAIHLLLNIGMSTLFLLLLYFVYHNFKSASEDIAKLEENLSASIVRPKEKPLPEMPVEEWQYPSLLMNMEIEVSANSQPQTEKSSYILWCGSFREKFRADKMVSQISSIIPAYTVIKGEWNVVNTKPFAGKRLGEKIRHKLRRAYNITTCNFKRAKFEDSETPTIFTEEFINL